MAISKNIEDREYLKFRDGHRVAVSVENGLVSGIDYDALSFEYPNTQTEIIRFRQINETGAIIASVEIRYTDSTKENIQYAKRI